MVHHSVGWIRWPHLDLNPTKELGLMLRKLLAIVAATSMVACYNTYNISLDEMAKAQEGGVASAIEVKTDSGELVVISENSKMGVTSKAGEYYAVSPFNFTLTRGQLIAPDEDLLIGRSNIETGNIKQASLGKTAVIVLAGIAAVAGGAAFVLLTAEEKKGFGE